FEPVSTTPLWVPILIAALGVAGTLGGVVVTQKRSDRREDTRWERERQREHEAWAHEDSRRTFDHRRECYVDLHQRLREATLLIHNFGYGLGPALEFEWNLPMYESLLRLEVYGTHDAQMTARQVYNAAWHWGKT